MAEHYKDIQGWFDFSDIYDKAIERINKRGKFVEVGVWKGKSVVYMAERIKEEDKQIKLYAVDKFEGHHLLVENKELKQSGDSWIEEVQENLKKAEVEDIVELKQGWSRQVAIHEFEDNTMDFIFIDGSHEYKEVVKDLEAWFPKLKKNGMFAGHDYTPHHKGVIKAVDEFVKKYSLEDNFSTSNSSWMIEL